MQSFFIGPPAHAQMHRKPNAAAQRVSMRMFAYFCLFLGVSAIARDAAADAVRYQMPPQPMVEMVDAPLVPQTTLSPTGEWMLLLERPALPAIAELAQPELRLAGLRINPRNNDQSRAGFASAAVSMRFLRLSDRTEKIVQGIPAGARIGEALWSPDGKRVAFTAVRDNTVELMIAEVSNGAAAKRLGERALNPVMGRAFTWFGDSKSLLVSFLPAGRGAPPRATVAPSGPGVQENLGKRAAARTYQDLLRSSHDEALFDYYASAEVARVWLDGKAASIASGVIRAFSPSPDGQYAMIQTIKRPYSYSVPLTRFATRTEIRDALETNIGAVVRTLSDLPLADDEELDPDAVRKGPRQYQWRADANATIVWAQAIAPEKRGSIGDYVFMLPSPFDDEPQLLEKTDLRFQSIAWGKYDAAILTEASSKTRRVISWRIYPFDPGKTPIKLYDRSSEDRYGAPGTPVTEMNARGQRVLNFAPDGKSVYLIGQGASPEGERPFLDTLNLDTKETKRLFQSEAPFFDTPLQVFDTNVAATGARLLVQRESANDAPNLFVRELDRGRMTQVTKFATPRNPLANISKEVIRYKRKDGVELSGTLYLPAGFKRGDDPLPLVMWAYPREFRSADAAGQVSGSPHRYVRPAFSGALPFLTQGYAVLDNPSMPIVGDNGKEPNDTYLPQLISSAEAAIDEVVRRGVADRNRIAIGGHSYGAFMVANLLAHTKLFAAGIAQSGAYNRTLTPFGFQAEDRNFWKARDVYSAMSPFNYADQIKTPLLMIHGEADSNTGTFPLQSERMYQAMRGLGGTVRLVMLPHEDHGYRARESVLHRLWEANRWLDKYVKNGEKRSG
jgi:dipeptidyl aminopeptidase/acylaminoacyl peptidase